MALKTRYLQVSDVMMFEYRMLGENDECSIQKPGSFFYTTLKNDHLALVSPVSYEVEETEDRTFKRLYEPLTLNTINHMAVPKDAKESLFYSFLDPDYEYVDSSLMSGLTDPNQVKTAQYLPYLNDVFNEIDCGVDTRWDSARMYFVNGYDFSNIYGMYMKVYIDNVDGTTETDKVIDLCNFFFNRETAFKLVQYLSNPIIFGNNVYDRYIEVNLPCIYDLVNQNESGLQESEYSNDLANLLQLQNGTVVKVSFAYILSDDKEVETIDVNISDLLNGANITSNLVNCTFTRSSSMKGSIPTSNINSDNLGVYIAECTDKPYLEFYGTWRDNPLTKEVVWKFNKGIRLYDTSLIKQEHAYEVDDDYSPEYDMKKWIAIHEIKASFCMDNAVVKEETYNMNQLFVSDKDPVKFYYRPTIFDENIGLYINNIQFVYTMRFVNVNDRVQFVKTASLSLSGNLQKFYGKGTTLTTAQLTPYKIFNKVVESHTTVNNAPATPVQQTKYVKVYYDSTNIVLDENGENSYGSYGYTLNMSQVPKLYKFVFKRMNNDGKYDFMDLTDGYYKLLYVDENGKKRFIDPTYSTNMNLYLGELEFAFNATDVELLQKVAEGSRKMSIVSYGDDETVSSMFDFLYTI